MNDWCFSGVGQRPVSDVSISTPSRSTSDGNFKLFFSFCQCLASARCTVIGVFFFAPFFFQFLFLSLCSNTPTHRPPFPPFNTTNKRLMVAGLRKPSVNTKKNVTPFSPKKVFLLLNEWRGRRSQKVLRKDFVCTLKTCAPISPTNDTKKWRFALWQRNRGNYTQINLSKIILKKTPSFIAVPFPPLYKKPFF